LKHKNFQNKAEKPTSKLNQSSIAEKKDSISKQSKNGIHKILDHDKLIEKRIKKL
jgi:hypothetical protein